jgi:hypothetical protein
MDRHVGRMVMRPLKSSSAIEHARRLLALGVGKIEERAGGLWAEGPDRRTTPRDGDAPAEERRHTA